VASQVPLADLEAMLEVARSIYQPVATQLNPARGYPRSILDGRSWWQSGPGDWTSGFFAGVLWQLASHTKSELLVVEARRWTEGLASQATISNHDLGFMIGNSFGLGYQHTGDPGLLPVLTTAAATLVARFDDRVGAIRSWNFEPFQYPVIIDSLMNLELLFLVARLNQDPSLADIAVQHADKVRQNHVRNDGSSYHVVDYSASSGAVRWRGTHQGKSDSSTWARGQAWGIYGFTMVYRETGEQRFLEAAIQMADYFLANLPADGIPFWDFSADPGEPRDSSAAAIAASALWELANLAEDDATCAQYKLVSLNLVEALQEPGFWVADTGLPALLGRATGHFPQRSEVEVPIIYADYYLVEAMRRQAYE
jgi:rhamnogalacturonyl hydrolase YesR